MRIGIIVLTGFALLVFPLASSAEEAPASSEGLETEVQEILTDTSGMEAGRVQKLVELGFDAAPAICGSGEKGKIRPEALKALARLRNPAVCDCLLDHLVVKRRTQDLHQNLCIIALRHCRAKNALWVLLQIMWDGKNLRDADSEELSLALDAAAAVRVLGEPNERAEAQNFILVIMREVPCGIEDMALSPLLTALSQCDSPEGYDYIAEHLANQWTSEDLLLSLPRNAGHRGLVEGVYKHLTQVACDVGEEPPVEMACLEALSEMDLTSQVVPEDFWQEYWNARGAYLVGHGDWYQTPEKITPDMFNARHRAFMEKMHIVWDPEATNSK